MNKRPPKWALRFFRWFCREDLVDAVEGDLLENYQRNVLANRAKANFHFILSVLRFFQPIIIKNNKYPVYSRIPSLTRLAVGAVALRRTVRPDSCADQGRGAVGLVPAQRGR